MRPRAAAATGRLDLGQCREESGEVRAADGVVGGAVGGRGGGGGGGWVCAVVSRLLRGRRDRVFDCDNRIVLVQGKSDGGGDDGGDGGGGGSGNVVVIVVMIVVGDGVWTATLPS